VAIDRHVADVVDHGPEIGGNEAEFLGYVFAAFRDVHFDRFPPQSINLGSIWEFAPKDNLG
jgi:hypothetical protein